MKQILVLILLPAIMRAQNVGIGTANPIEKLDVAGAIKIGGTATNVPAAGTIRWNADRKDFEGHNGNEWVSLTSNKSAWGNLVSYSIENAVTSITIGSNSAGFATSLASNGDFLVAGAGMENFSNANEAGGFRLFKKEGGLWQVKQSVHAPDFSSEINFGKAVAMNEGFIVAGAEGASINGKNRQGKLYVYTLNNNIASYGLTLSATDGASEDMLGYSVAMHNNQLIAGAPFHNIGLSIDRGAAYVFSYNGSAWQQTAQLWAPGGASNDRLGQSVSIYGNLAVAGAPNASVGDQSAQGKVFLFQYNGTSWAYLTTLTAPSSGPNQYFGTSVSLSGDTLVVGSNENMYSITGKGKAYVFVRSGNTWLLQTTLTAPDGQTDDGFGTSVHLKNGSLLVGAPKARLSGTRQGKSYLYKATPEGWALQAILASSNGGANDRFGSVVHLTDSAAVCSAPYADVLPNDNNGRIYFFRNNQH